MRGDRAGNAIACGRVRSRAVAPFAGFVDAIRIRFDVPFKTRFNKSRAHVFLLAENVEDVPCDCLHSLAPMQLTCAPIYPFLMLATRFGVRRQAGAWRRRNCNPIFAWEQRWVTRSPEPNSCSG